MIESYEKLISLKYKTISTAKEWEWELSLLLRTSDPMSELITNGLSSWNVVLLLTCLDGEKVCSGTVFSVL